VSIAGWIRAVLAIGSMSCLIGCWWWINAEIKKDKDSMMFGMRAMGVGIVLIVLSYLFAELVYKFDWFR